LNKPQQHGKGTGYDYTHDYRRYHNHALFAPIGAVKSVAVFALLAPKHRVFFLMWSNASALDNVAAGGSPCRFPVETIERTPVNSRMHRVYLILPSAPTKIQAAT